MSNPNSIDPFRQCLGQFATGVVVVTCSNSQGAPCGITANSFSAVSLDPPLVLWNIAKSSNSLQAYLDADFFAIHMLTAAQRDMSSHFARSIHTLFEDIVFSRSENDVPILPDCLSRLECSTHAIHDCGDHYIIVGHVDEHISDAGEPLLFFDGGYCSINSAD
jgi:flavin reductase (DIM6/NTAB) family NADH-FMN oxidoreductase RutF